MSQLIVIPAIAIAAVIGLAIILVVTIGLAARIARSRLRRANPPVGSQVSAAGTTQHVIRRGPDHGPTVVFVAGVGGIGAVWAGIQERLGPTVASLAYDRAGLGWSDPARSTRTAAEMADELHELLEASAAPAPYVLVGHSLGGVIARHFAHRHPQGVAGLVLVDSAHEEQYTRLPEVARVFRRMSSMPGPIVRLMGALTAIRAGRAALDPRLPAAAAVAVRAGSALSATHLPTAMAEMRAVAHGNEPVGDLGDLPLVVLRHGRYERMPMLDEAVNDRFEALFAELQGELAGLSTRGRVVVADGAGHDIHLDRPDLVVEAIRTVAAEASAGAIAPPAHVDPVAPQLDLAEARVPPPSRPAGAEAPPPTRPEGEAPMTTRLATSLASIARPMLVLTATLVALGSAAAAAGVEAGWLVYLAGYASAVITFPALAAAHGGRLGRRGLAAFAFLTATIVLATPVVAMVASYVLRLEAIHLALMPYAMSLPGMVGAFGANLGLVLVGVTVARAAVFPATAGWLLAAAAIAELPVELGIMPLPVWAFAMVAIAVAFLAIARSMAVEPRRTVAPVGI